MFSWDWCEMMSTDTAPGGAVTALLAPRGPSAGTRAAPGLWVHLGMLKEVVSSFFPGVRAAWHQDVL